MGLTTDEKEFTVEHYFRPYGNGKQSGPSLKLVTEQYRSIFIEIGIIIYEHKKQCMIRKNNKKCFPFNVL